MLRLVTTLIASEVERVRAPERASEEAAARFLRAVLARRIDDRDDLMARGKELGTDVSAPAPASLVVRAHAAQPDRGRLAPAAAGGRRPRRPLDRARRDRGAERRRRRGRVDPDPGRRWRDRRRCRVRDPARARVGAGGVRVRDRPQPPRRGPAASCSARSTRRCWRERRRGRAGAVRTGVRGDRHLSAAAALHERPCRAQALLRETVRPLVSYDEQYETDLLGTLATFLDCDANVNATAARLITHRHTIRYRFERVRELTGLDVSVDRWPREAVARA